jgi:hypothetical protein
MKNLYKLLMLTFFCSALYVSCNLEENPPYLSQNSVYEDEATASTALNGVFNPLTNQFYYGHDYHVINAYMSGMFAAKKGSDRYTIGALSPTPTFNYITKFWELSYQTIGRANDMIANVEEGTGNVELDNILGIAYFVRANTYLNLVRLYGGVPLKIAPATAETLHQPRASKEDVYALIIADGEKAKSLMKEPAEQIGGRPGKYAANMLLAKAYMTLAGNDNTSAYWQKAYDEAIQVYGQYTLVSNFDDLFSSEATANNNSESIYEIQFNSEVPSKIGRVFTPNAAYAGSGWERIRALPEVVDAHAARYPDDPRYNFTFRDQYNRFNNNTLVKVYPARTRANFNVAFTYINKYFVKDQTTNTDANNYNFVQYRYGDLLLMLAEIENELNGPANAYKYVNEVLTRARNSGTGVTEPANWSGLSQDDFRAAIMKEYHFELLGEGHDFFVGHRRGYDFFKTNYIDVHNARNDKGFDPVFPENESVMLLPIPSDEIGANREISISDQNPGY